MLGILKSDGSENISHSLRYNLAFRMAPCLLPKKSQLLSEALKLECPHFKGPHIYICKKGLHESRVICAEGI